MIDESFDQSRSAEQEEFFRLPKQGAIEAARNAGLDEYAEALEATRNELESGDEATRREVEFAEEENVEEQQFRLAQVEDFHDDLEAAFLAAGEDGEG